MSEMKKNTLLLIDAENVSHKKADVIMRWVKLQGVIDKGKVYGRQKDLHTKGWSEKSRKHPKHYASPATNL